MIAEKTPKQLKREELGQLAMDGLRQHDFLFLNWATGVGKTYASLCAIAQYPINLKWVVVVKELFHIQTWKDEIVKWEFPENMVEYITYHSLHKLDKSLEYGLIMDEAHALTPKRRDKLYTLKVRACIALSATMPADKEFMLNCWMPFHRIKYSLVQSIEDGVTPKPDIRVIDVRVNKSQEDELALINIEMAKTKARMRNSPRAADELMFLAFERKRMMARFKFEHVEKFLKEMESYRQRSIIFVNSIEQCNLVGKDKAIHSENPHRKELLRQFNGGDLHVLYAVNMLRESANLFGIEVGLLAQVDSEDRGFLQVAGRVFRSNQPVLYILRLVSPNTHSPDELYVKSCLDTLSEYATYHKLEDIYGFKKENFRREVLQREEGLSAE